MTVTTLVPTDDSIRQFLNSVAAAIYVKIRRNSVKRNSISWLPLRVLMFLLKLVIKISNNET